MKHNGDLVIYKEKYNSRPSELLCVPCYSPQLYLLSLSLDKEYYY